MSSLRPQPQMIVCKVERNEGRYLATVFPFLLMETFYNQKRWIRLRERILRRDKYVCQVSKRYGKITEGNTVHHIFPRDDFPEYQYEPWNLITVSASTHDRLHERNSQTLTEQGIDLLVRTARKHGITIPQRYMERRRATK